MRHGLAGYAASSCWTGAWLLAESPLALVNPPGLGWTAGLGESSDGRQALPVIGPRGQAVIDQPLARATGLALWEHGRWDWQLAVLRRAAHDDAGQEQCLRQAASSGAEPTATLAAL